MLLGASTVSQRSAHVASTVPRSRKLRQRNRKPPRQPLRKAHSRRDHWPLHPKLVPSAHSVSVASTQLLGLTGSPKKVKAEVPKEASPALVSPAKASPAKAGRKLPGFMQKDAAPGECHLPSSCWWSLSFVPAEDAAPAKAAPKMPPAAAIGAHPENQIRLLLTRLHVQMMHHLRSQNLLSGLSSLSSRRMQD